MRGPPPSHRPHVDLCGPPLCPTQTCGHERHTPPLTCGYVAHPYANTNVGMCGPHLAANMWICAARPLHPSAQTLIICGLWTCDAHPSLMHVIQVGSHMLSCVYLPLARLWGWRNTHVDMRGHCVRPKQTSVPLTWPHLEPSTTPPLPKRTSGHHVRPSPLVMSHVRMCLPPLCPLQRQM